MEMILELQKLEVPVDEDFFGSSCTSSFAFCCSSHAVA